MRIRFGCKWLVNAFAVGALLGGMALPALAQSGPAFSTRTPVSGELGSTFFVFLPIFNSGSVEADNVQLTSATLGNATLTSPVVPVAVGTLAAGDYYNVDLQFSASNLVLGQNYLLTIRGTYTLGSETLGFALNRFVAPSVATGATLTGLQHWVVLNAMTAFANNLPGVDRTADDQAMLTFIQSRPEFVASGIDASSFSVWAVFANGEEVAFVNDRIPSSGSTTAHAKPPAAIKRGIPGTLVASLVPMIPAATPAPPPTEADAAELPASSDVRLMNALPPPSFGDGQLVIDLATILTPQSYKVRSEPPTVFNLICVDPTSPSSACASGPVGGDGVFYYTSHGGFVGDGTPGAPLRFGVWTTTKWDLYWDSVLPAQDTVGTPANPLPNLIKLIAVGSNVKELHYAITASFVRAHFQQFSNNSFIYIDACSSDDPRTGPDSAQDFKQAFFDKNASVYAGWTFTNGDDLAANSARLVFDRLLGANKFFLETGPPQRPFPWPSLPEPDGDLLKHSLGADTDTGAFLEFHPNPSAVTPLIFGLLAPSIGSMDILEGATNQFSLNGVFGSDPGVNGGVFVGGSDPSPYPWVLSSQTSTAGGVEVSPCDWTTDQGFIIICSALPFTGSGSYGNVQVTVRGHNSNVARITEWQGPFTFKMKSIGGPQDTFDTLSGTLTLNTAFRADIRSYRPVIHDPPAPPIAPGFELIPPLSSAPFSCGGSAQNVVQTAAEPTISTYTWTGSGNLQPFDLSSASSGNLPPTQSFNSGGILMGTASSLPLNLTLEARGGSTECTSTITTNFGGNSMFTFDIPFGAINLSLNLDPVTAVIPAPQSPLQFPNTGCPFAPGDGSCDLTINWNAISPVGSSAPDPNSAR